MGAPFGVDGLRFRHLLAAIQSLVFFLLDAWVVLLQNCLKVHPAALHLLTLVVELGFVLLQWHSSHVYNRQSLENWFQQSLLQQHHLGLS